MTPDGSKTHAPDEKKGGRAPVHFRRNRYNTPEGHEAHAYYAKFRRLN
jgi:hypothetical protein